MTQLIQSSSFITSLVFTLCLMIGCGGSSHEKYIPATATARTALEAALNEWKSGAAHGTIKSSKVPIDVYDARWQSGKKLETFEILREEKSDGPKTFIVKMKLNEDKEEKEVTYLVVGINPLLIFREQDYKKATGTGG